MYCDRSAYYQKAIKATLQNFLKVSLTCCGFFCFLGDYSFFFQVLNVATKSINSQ